MTERQLEAAVADLARSTGALRYHTHRSDRSEPGWPDDAIVRGDLLCLWELKQEKGRISEAQARWLGALQMVRRIDVRVIRPRDLQTAARILMGSRETTRLEAS